MANMKPISHIKARLGIEPNGKTQKFFTNTCKRYMDKYVPYQEGNLKTNVDIQDDKIVYQSPYAHYQFTGVVYVDPETKKGAFYSRDYGFWSRRNIKKIPSGRKLTYKTPRNWTALGQKNGECRNRQGDKRN